MSKAFDVKAWRTRMGWTKERAAAALGMSLRAYYTLESGGSRTRRVHVLSCAMLETIKFRHGYVPTPAAAAVGEI